MFKRNYSTAFEMKQKLADLAMAGAEEEAAEASQASEGGKKRRRRAPLTTQDDELDSEVTQQIFGLEHRETGLRGDFKKAL